MTSNTFHTMHPHFKPCFYGSATIGTKGQIVIPANAREDLHLQPGDKVVVIGVKERGMVGICKLESVEQLFTQMSERLTQLREVIETTKETKED